MYTKKKYISLEHTIKEVKRAAIMGLNFCADFVPSMYRNDPEGLFYFLKSETTYKKDPPDIELLQRPQTLMTKKNYWGKPGAGDCDCFTILTLACLHIIGQKNLIVSLVGRNNQNPSHIYAGFLSKKNFVAFDLTNHFYNTERRYNYRQLLNCNLYA